MKGGVRSFEVSFFVHETEDAGKVARSVRGAFGLDDRPMVEEMAGHFGNRIARYSFLARGAEAQAAFDSLKSFLSPRTIKEVASSLSELVDEHANLYLRFDKQALVRGEAVFGGPDPVRVVARPRQFVPRGKGVDYFEEALGIEA